MMGQRRRDRAVVLPQHPDPAALLHLLIRGRVAGNGYGGTQMLLPLPTLFAA